MAFARFPSRFAASSACSLGVRKIAGLLRVPSLDKLCASRDQEVDEMADEEQVRKETAEDAADDLDLTDGSAEEVRGGALQAYLKLSGQKSGSMEQK